MLSQKRVFQCKQQMDIQLFNDPSHFKRSKQSTQLRNKTKLMDTQPEHDDWTDVMWREN